MIRAALAEARVYDSWFDYQEALKRAIAPLTIEQLQRRLLPALRTPGKSPSISFLGEPCIYTAHWARKRRNCGHC